MLEVNHRVTWALSRWTGGSGAKSRATQSRAASVDARSDSASRRAIANRVRSQVDRSSSSRGASTAASVGSLDPGAGELARGLRGRRRARAAPRAPSAASPRPPRPTRARALHGRATRPWPAPAALAPRASEVALRAAAPQSIRRRSNGRQQDQTGGTARSPAQCHQAGSEISGPDVADVFGGVHVRPPRARKNPMSGPRYGRSVSTSRRSTCALRTSERMRSSASRAMASRRARVRRAPRVHLDDLAGLGVLERQQAHRRELPIKLVAESDRDHVVSLRESTELGSRLLNPGLVRRESPTEPRRPRAGAVAPGRAAERKGEVRAPSLRLERDEIVHEAKRVRAPARGRHEGLDANR